MKDLWDRLLDWWHGIDLLPPETEIPDDTDVPSDFFAPDTEPSDWGALKLDPKSKHYAPRRDDQ